MVSAYTLEELDAEIELTKTAIRDALAIGRASHSGTSSLETQSLADLKKHLDYLVREKAQLTGRAGPRTFAVRPRRDDSWRGHR